MCSFDPGWAEISVGTALTRAGRRAAGAAERLEQAALDLYQKQGFESTTVAEIAERAGMTERTFFRHYADKREVLFASSAQGQQFLVPLALDQEPQVAPLETVTAAVCGTAEIFEERRQFVKQRQAIIAANPELQERELIKMAALAAALADALRQRGVPEPRATLAAEAGMAIFRVAFERWSSGPDHLSLRQVIDESAEALLAVASAS